LGIFSKHKVVSASIAHTLDDTFGLRQTFESKSLEKWLNDAQKQELSEQEKIFGSVLQKLLISNRSSWQEQELAMHFIGPMFSVINFTELYKYNLFAQRHIS